MALSLLLFGASNATTDATMEDGVPPPTPCGVVCIPYEQFHRVRVSGCQGCQLPAQDEGRREIGGAGGTGDVG